MRKLTKQEVQDFMQEYRESIYAKKYQYIFDELIKNSKLRGVAPYTDFLLSANIDFLSYMNKIVEDLFSEIDITTIHIPSNIEKIEADAFAGSTVENFIIAPGLKEIEARAFSYNNKLTSIIFPETLTKIAVSAFQDCKNIEKIYINNATILPSIIFIKKTLESTSAKKPHVQLLINNKAITADIRNKYPLKDVPGETEYKRLLIKVKL